MIRGVVLDAAIVDIIHANSSNMYPCVRCRRSVQRAMIKLRLNVMANHFLDVRWVMTHRQALVGAQC